MVQKCKNCGESIAKFPLRDSTGKFLWKNLFKMSFDSILLIIIIIAMVVTYKYDMAKCEEMIADPLEYCERTNACKILNYEAKTNYSKYLDPAGVPIFDLDIPEE